MFMQIIKATSGATFTISHGTGKHDCGAFHCQEHSIPLVIVQNINF